MNYCDITLCELTPVSIACMAGFLHLIRLLSIPFSITLFRIVFRSQLVSDGYTCPMARNNREFLERLLNKLGIHWQRRFFFFKLPGDYPLKRYWKDPIKGIANEPDM